MDTVIHVPVQLTQQLQLLAHGQGEPVMEEHQLPVPQEHGHLCARGKQRFGPVRAADQVTAVQRHPRFVRQVQAGEQHPDLRSLGAL